MIGAATGKIFLAKKDINLVSYQWGSSKIRRGYFFTVGTYSEESSHYKIARINGEIQMGDFFISIYSLILHIQQENIIELKSNEDKLEIIGNVSRLSLVE